MKIALAIATALAVIILALFAVPAVGQNNADGSYTLHTTCEQNAIPTDVCVTETVAPIVTDIPAVDHIYSCPEGYQLATYMPALLSVASDMPMESAHYIPMGVISAPDIVRNGAPDCIKKVAPPPPPVQPPVLPLPASPVPIAGTFSLSDIMPTDAWIERFNVVDRAQNLVASCRVKDGKPHHCRIEPNYTLDDLMTAIMEAPK